MNKPRVILDTNLLVSHALTPRSLVAEAVRHASFMCQLLASQATVDELIIALRKKKFSAYLTEPFIKQYVANYVRLVEWVPILEHVRVCRDPDDDKFLELAAAGNAEYLVTGDQDLLSLSEFHHTQILSAKDFLKAIVAV